MYESRIVADPVTVAASPGFSPEIDALAAHSFARYGFLRAAWYGAGGDSESEARTLLVRRRDTGVPLAAIPTVPFGPAIAGARKVPGPYWPLRGVLVAPDCDTVELAEALCHHAANCLGPVWRLGPARACDPALGRLVAAARLAGWSVLSRPAGTSWVVDCAALREAGWPRNSTEKRIARMERRLAKHGAVSWQYVRGRDWNKDVFAELGSVEAASWIGSKTDGSGAKFMTPRQRAQWRNAVSDPVLGAMLCATILRVGGRAVAFSFDCDDGPVRYGIAGSYRTDFGKYEVGKLANKRSLSDAIGAGQQVVDFGAGDSGYKRDMGAVPGYDLADLLFVRSRIAARVLERVWGPPMPAPEPMAMEVPAHG